MLPMHVTSRDEKSRGREVINIKAKDIRLNVLKKTQQEMADMLNITRGAYCRKEIGLRDWKWQEILKICDKANLDPRVFEE